MEKQKDPAFLFYPQDFLTGTYFMTYEQKGKFIELLCLQHKKGALTKEQINTIVEDDDVEVLENFIQNEDGKWYNRKLLAEMNRRSNFTERQRENGKKGGVAKAKGIAMPKPDSTPRTETETITVTKAFKSKTTNTPNHLLTQSLDDLYSDLEHDLSQEPKTNNLL